MNEVVSLVLTYRDGSTQTITVTSNTTMDENQNVPVSEETVSEAPSEAAPVEESAPEAVEEAPAEEAA